MRVLISGINGQIGSYLAEFYLTMGWEVHGLVRQRANLTFLSSILSNIDLHIQDIRDPHGVMDIVLKVKPKVLHHLAGMTYVPYSWDNPSDTFETNCLGTINVLEAARRLVQQTSEQIKVHFASSSEVYGAVPKEEIPITEETKTYSASPYGISKYVGDLLCQQYYRSYSLGTVITRTFNHSVPRWTPVVLRDNSNLIDIRPIDSIRKPPPSAFQKVGEDEYIAWRLSGSRSYEKWFDVWSNPGFSRVYEVSAHPTTTKLKLIVTGHSILCSTDNHSIIGPEGEPISAGEVKIGDRLGGVKELPNSEVCTIPEDLAWFYGFFMAEGWAGNTGRQRGNPNVHISNNDENLLQKCRSILLRYYGIESRIFPNSNCLTLKASHKERWLGWFLRETFYLKDGNKKIPKVVLNGDKATKLAFLSGYNEGDGLIDGHGSYSLKSFTTKSPTVAMGLCYLIRNTTDQRWTLNVEPRGDKLYWHINLNSPNNENWGRHLEKPSNIVKKIIDINYADWVYDFSTSSGAFHGGIGLGLLHNTSPRRGQHFLTMQVVTQALAIKHGKRGHFTLGNLDSVRDFTDARDIVQAYYMAVTNPAIKYGFPYVVCSERGYSARNVVDMVSEIAGISGYEIKQDPARMRPSDCPILVGSCKLFRETTGWHPKVPFKDTLRWMLETLEEMEG